jgi:hypothetical protein
MKTKTIYIADDETEFHSQEECVNYEKNTGLREFLLGTFFSERVTMTTFFANIIAGKLLKEYHIVKRNREVLNQGNDNR